MQALERLELSLADMESTRERKDREFRRLQANLMQLLLGAFLSIILYSLFFIDDRCATLVFVYYSLDGDQLDMIRYDMI